MSTTTTRCPRCGALRATGATWLDLCPACLLAAALSPDDEPCPYQVLAPIAESPVAVTYLAQALTGKRGYAALKIYAPREDTDQVLSRYQRWAPVLQAFDHPGFCRLLHVGLTAAGQLFVASEYVQGWPLTAIDGRTSVTAATRLEIAHQLVAAVDAAHAAGLVHLELAPPNVKCSAANEAQTTILGLGLKLIVDGADARRESDVAALLRLVRVLGVVLPDRDYESVANVRAELARRG